MRWTQQAPEVVGSGPGVRVNSTPIAANFSASDSLVRLITNVLLTYCIKSMRSDFVRLAVIKERQDRCRHREMRHTERHTDENFVVIPTPDTSSCATVESSSSKDLWVRAHNIVTPMIYSEQNMRLLQARQSRSKNARLSRP